MYIFDNTKSYDKQLHNIYLKTKRNTSTSVSFEIDRLANDDSELAAELLETYTERYGYPAEVAAKDGHVYLMKAIGFYGIFSPIVCRYKIGKSNNPKRRHIELNGQQAPCPIDCIRYIAVDDMAAIESKLHNRFKGNRVHGEWFVFWRWEMPMVHLAYQFIGDSLKTNKKANFPNKSTVGFIILVLLALLSASAVISSAIVHQTQEMQPIEELKNDGQ
ncbi:MAG: GIY-YIG nuclease family protein [Brasilonema angustatum HA4187-MV1]|jgi:hypothetical protein|nr:GIY-YIG nuclease family protein [Brasilonema angustatum HA4187-MV1]